MDIKRFAHLRFHNIFKAKEDYEVDEYQKKMKTIEVIYGYLLNMVCISGVIGNILSYIIMRSREFRDSTTSIYLQVSKISQ